MGGWLRRILKDRKEMERICGKDGYGMGLRLGLPSGDALGTGAVEGRKKARQAQGVCLPWLKDVMKFDSGRL